MTETHAKQLESLHSLSTVLYAIDDDGVRAALRAGAAAIRALVAQPPMTETQTRAAAWVAWASRTAFGDKHLRLQIEEAAYLLALVAQPPAPSPEVEQVKELLVDAVMWHPPPYGDGLRPLIDALIAAVRAEGCDHHKKPVTPEPPPLSGA